MLLDYFTATGLEKRIPSSDDYATLLLRNVYSPEAVTRPLINSPFTTKYTRQGFMGFCQITIFSFQESWSYRICFIQSNLP